MGTVDDLIARLTLIIDGDGGGEAVREARDLLAAQDKTIAALREALKECADDLASEIEARFNSVKRHPAMANKYERDMVPVNNARAALALAEETERP